MKNLKLKTSLMAFMVMATMSISAQPANYGEGSGKEGSKGRHGQKAECKQGQNRGDRMMINLELSDEQKTKIEALHLDHQKKILPLKNELGEKEARMNTLQTAAIADMKAINSLIDEMGAIKVKMQKERAAHHQEIRKILTEEQRIKFDLHAGEMGHQKHGDRN